MARFVGITCNAFALDYVDKDKAWEACKTASSIMCRHYTDWKEFADAFLFNRAFEYGFDDEPFLKFAVKWKNVSKIVIMCLMTTVLFGRTIPSTSHHVL